MSRVAASARPIPRRGLRRDEAAAYVGISPSKFDQAVSDGRMPRPRKLDGCVIWDVRELDAAFDDLPTDRQSDGGNEWDDVAA
jgi:Predicted transcriptional regulator